MPIAQTIARNTAWNALGRAVEMAVGLVLAYYVVRRLGAEGWGLWSLVGALVGYAALFDMGMGSGFSKYIAEHAARKDRAGVSAVVSTGFWFYAAFGAAFLAVGWPLMHLLATRVIAPFAGAEAPIDTLLALGRGALLLFAINAVCAPFAAVPVGLQRMGLANAISMAAALLKLGAAVALLEAGWGVRGLIAAQAVALLFVFIASAGAAFWLFPGLRVGPGQCTRQAFGALFGFGWRTQVAKLSNVVNFQTDRVVIAALGGFANMATVGLYGLGETLAGKMRQVPALLVSALVPAASDLDARDRQAQLAALYVRGTRYMTIVAAPLALYCVAGADMLMRAWLGPTADLEVAANVLRILALGYLVNLLPGPGVSIVMGKGRAEAPMYAGLISMSANIALTVVLYLTIGFYGVPIATALGLLISTAWFYWYMPGIVPVGWRTLLHQAILGPLFAALPGMALCAGVQYAVWGNTGQWENLGAAVLGLALFGAAYLAALRWSRVLDDYDRRFLIETLGLGRAPGAAWLLGARQQ